MTNKPIKKQLEYPKNETQLIERVPTLIKMEMK